MLRPTRVGEAATITNWAGTGAAQIHIAAAAAGPVGGDQLSLHVDVGAESTLVLSEISPTLLLPGPDGDRSRTEITATVAAGGTLAWLPQLVIAAHGCNHRTDTRIALEPGARLLVREQVLLGRHREDPGKLAQRLRVTSEGKPLHDQEFAVDPAERGWAGPSVLAGARSVGTLLLIDNAAPAPPSTADTDAAVMPLAEGGLLASALAPDTASLRHLLDQALSSMLPG